MLIECIKQYEESGVIDSKSLIEKNKNK